MKNFRQNIYSKQSIIENWNELRVHFPKSTAAGVDGMSRAVFDSSLDKMAPSIASDLQNNYYTFSKLKLVPIAKPTNGYRPICVPTIKDRFVQRMMLQEIVRLYRDRLETNIGFGALSGTGNQAAVKIIRKMNLSGKYIVRTDISKFFDTIPRDRLFRSVQKIIRHSSLHELLKRVIEMEVDTSSPQKKRNFENCKLQKSKGLRQGMPLSPLLAHMYLLDFDKCLLKEGFQTIRYVDDILIVSENRSEAEKAFNLARQSLLEIGLTLPDLKEDKSTIIEPNTKFEFLGIDFIPSLKENTPTRIQVPDSIRKRLIDKMLNAVDFDSLPPSQKSGAIQKYISSLSALDKGYAACYSECENYDALKDWLDNAKRRSLNLFIKNVAEMHKNGGGASWFLKHL